jgi:hypothetical protein
VPLITFQHNTTRLLQPLHAGVYRQLAAGREKQLLKFMKENSDRYDVSRFSAVAYRVAFSQQQYVAAMNILAFYLFVGMQF